MKEITDTIRYIPPMSNPLSANVGMIEGESALWLYDVGHGEQILKVVEQAADGRKICAVLSHFHPDHIGNLDKISCAEIYLGRNTYKYTQCGIIVDKPMQIIDGSVELHILPIPSSHAKGSLALELDETYCFVGDALYPARKGLYTVYNAGLLQEQIRFLKKLKAGWLLISHQDPFVQEKQRILAYLEEVYERREKDQAYITISENR